MDTNITNHKAASISNKHRIKKHSDHNIDNIQYQQTTNTVTKGTQEVIYKQLKGYLYGNKKGQSKD